MRLSKSEKKARRRAATAAKVGKFDRWPRDRIAQYQAQFPHLYAALCRARLPVL